MSQPATARQLTSVRSTVTPTAAPSSVVISQPQPVDLVIYRGDTGRFRVSVTDPQGAPLDVSTASWNAQIRQNADDPQPVTAFTIQPVSGDTSSIDVILNASESATLDFSTGAWDLQMSMGGEITTLMAGKVNVTADVSRP